ncbi:MAG TPA: hypothetical protein VGQ44_00060 [Gemmatimonadaceae bacterium]|jgi:hypothetical protein|nr:hypothetical protein [Gemmatimonadaceae bacterium]
MFLPLIDRLRCLNVHEDTWLVASIDRADERDVVEGTLGCPVCSAEYRIREGVVWFGDAPAAAAQAPSSAEALRLAAALDLTDARMTAILHGSWGAHASVLRGLSPAQMLLVNPPHGVTSGDGISIVRSPVAPVAAGWADAAALDLAAGDAMAASVTTSLRTGGRLLAPAGAELPAGFSELARDADVWVAQLDAGAVAGAPIAISRRVPR